MLLARLLVPFNSVIAQTVAAISVTVSGRLSRPAVRSKQWTVLGPLQWTGCFNRLARTEVILQQANVRGLAGAYVPPTRSVGPLRVIVVMDVMLRVVMNVAPFPFVGITR